MYAATNTRSNFMYAVCLLSRFCSNSDSTHMVALQRLFKYIQSTLLFGTEYAPDEQDPHGFTDAD